MYREISHNRAENMEKQESLRILFILQIQDDSFKKKKSNPVCGSAHMHNAPTT